MRRLIPALAFVTLAVAACEQKVEAPAAPAPTPAPAVASDAAVAEEPADTRPGHVRREALARQAQANIEAQMAAQMQGEATADTPKH